MATEGARTYLKTHKISGRQVKIRLRGEVEAQLERAREARTGRSSKTLVKEGPLRITLIALRKGAHISKHHVDGQISIHVLRGKVTMWTEVGTTELTGNDILMLGDAVDHAVGARSDCAFLVTMSWHGEP